MDKNTIERRIRNQTTLESDIDLTTKPLRINKNMSVHIRESHTKTRNSHARNRLRQKLQNRQ